MAINPCFVVYLVEAPMCYCTWAGFAVRTLRWGLDLARSIVQSVAPAGRRGIRYGVIQPVLAGPRPL